MTESSNELRRQMPVGRTVSLRPPPLPGDPGTPAKPQSKRRGLPRISISFSGIFKSLAGLRPASALGLLVSPYLLLILTMLFWSGNWIFGRMVREEMTPVAFAYWRWLAALILIYPFAFRHLRANQALLFKHWKLLIVFGALGVGGFHTLVYAALSNTTVINASLVNSAMPIAIVCISWVMYREMVTWKQAVGIVTSLVGVVIIVARGDPEVLMNLTVNKGDLWAMAAVPVWGLYSVLLRRRPEAMHPMAFLGAIMIYGVLLLTPFFFWELVTIAPAMPGRETLIGVAYVAVFASVLAYIFWNRAVDKVGANKAGQFVHLLPVFATGLAVLFLGEALHIYHLAGVALRKAMAAVPVWGLYSVLLRRRPEAMHPMAFLGAIMIYGVLLLTPFFFWELVTIAPAMPGRETLIGVAYVAVFASVLAYIFWNRAVDKVGANKAGQFVHLLPVFATGLAVLFLGEALHIYHLAGVALIFAGIYLATIFGKPHTPAAQGGD